MAKSQPYKPETFFDSPYWLALKAALLVGVIVNGLLLIATRVFHLSGRQIVNLSAEILTFHWW